MILVSLAANKVDVVQCHMVEYFVKFGHLARHQDELGDGKTLMQPIVPISVIVCLAAMTPATWALNAWYHIYPKGSAKINFSRHIALATPSYCKSIYLSPMYTTQCVSWSHVFGHLVWM